MGLAPRPIVSACCVGIANPATILTARYAVIGNSVRADTPRVWSPASIQGVAPGNTAYDVHTDGKRVATSAAPEQTGSVRDKVVFVFNFGDYLRTIAPGTGSR